jgi:hypothetical protein
MSEATAAAPTALRLLEDVSDLQLKRVIGF